MTDRRAFLKSVAALGCFAPFGLAGRAAGVTHGFAPRCGIPLAELPWRRTIFCQFDRPRHAQLADAVEACAREIDCGIYWGEDGSPDLLACGCFVQIIDRSAVGEDIWRVYIAPYEHAMDITPCFIIDDRTDLPLPDWKYGYRVDLRQPEAVPTIVETIREMKSEMNRRLPWFFKRAEGLNCTEVTGRPEEEGKA